jgi:signal transduction histidine kinase
MLEKDKIPVLLVDDELRNLDVLESILEDPAYVLIRAVNADEALHTLLARDIAAIVLDVKMPGVDGIELARIIKGTKKFRQIPIVFLTAHLVEDKDVLSGYGAGAVDYLTKPIKPDILRQKVAVFADIFRKTRALAELNENLEKRVLERTADLALSERALRASNRQKDLFLATLAHELRNPLAPLRTGLDLLLRHPERPPILQKTLGAMNRQLDHMVRLIDDLLDVSRINRGTLEIRQAPIPLADVIERAIETVHPYLMERDQSVDLDVDASIVADVDETRIAQIVSNLLSNASKHSADGARIQVGLFAGPDEVTIRVVDEGAGIPADMMGSVFEMFTKIERPGTTNDGLGIGLALSRRLAELHGGTLTAESQGEGKGATFTLTLPQRPPDARRDSEAASETETRRPLRKRHTLRVVVVEDNTDSADVMTLWLETLGHDVKVAHSGPDGVTLILEAKPDVVLCDIGLPGMDGVDVCMRVVRQMVAPPVMVALTGWGMEADRTRTVQAGFRHHLVKPVEPEKLRSVLESIGQGD